ncbi:BglG family transcription antiterminator [Neobacillus kokaensis]|uniref:Transcriptional regulator ManR n=1 Tax=Neobacillus kokaensis TaxID=2759023 RepID=A0ABQ3NCM6_9BACI|nr:BglG family transcription antiterminator [Neobacillus kokaensis]GHI01668.1 transcriptional regulator ManR [Neobacillus kokaensis]
MNNRQKELLRILLVHEEGALHSKDLAEELGCSEKTVRNDLDRLEEYLLEIPSASLNRRPGLGMSLAIDEADRKDLLRRLFSSEPKTMEERLFEMAFQLLTSDKPITLQYWADRYYVAKAVIKKDIDTIANWLQRYDLEVVSKQRLGNTIQGTELKKRNALAHLSELIPSISSDKNLVLDLFLPYEISVVRKALQEMQHKFSISFTDGAFESLLVHALIMVKRTRQRSPVFVQASEMKLAAERQEYQFAGWFFEQLSSEFRLTFPEVERVYFSWHLMSSKRTEEGLAQVLQNDEETAGMVKALIRKMEKLTFFPFKADSILTNGLAVHMHSVINRIKFGFPITNPLLANIKRMYPYMFSMVILALEEIRVDFSIDIPEDEAAYIVLHFQASLERMEGKREAKKKALIVCHMGIGMSHLLEAKIEQQYSDIEILACIGKAEVADYLGLHQPDFIISTIPLEKITINHIVISPLFGQEDKKKLRQFVEELDRKGTNAREGALSPFLMEDLMFFDVEKEHRYEIVEMLARALFEKGYVMKEFIQSAVGRERSSATAIGGGIAIPHGDPTLIRTSAVAVGVLKNRLEWGSEQVSLVFMLAISKENQGDIRGLIGKIASLSESPLMVLALSGAKDYQDFLRLLDKNSES